MCVDVVAPTDTDTIDDNTEMVNDDSLVMKISGTKPDSDYVQAWAPHNLSSIFLLKMPLYLA